MTVDKIIFEEASKRPITVACDGPETRLGCIPAPHWVTDA